MAVVCVQGQSEIACESSIYVHAVLTWVRTLRPGDVNAACNGCVPMHQIGFDWLTAMSRDFRFTGQIGDNECIDVLVSDILTLAYENFGGAGSVMVWGGISHGVKTPLVVIQGNLTAVRYRDQVLMPHVLPLVNAHNLTFQHDNARPHVARVCRDFLNQNNVQVLDWPLDWPQNSPDLNPIEHLWVALDRRVRKRVNVPNNVAQLQLALIQEWNNIPQRTIDNLVGSMVRRERAATAARGGHTRYWYPLFNNVGCLCLTLFIANVVCYTTLNQ